MRNPELNNGLTFTRRYALRPAEVHLFVRRRPLFDQLPLKLQQPLEHAHILRGRAAVEVPVHLVGNGRPPMARGQALPVPEKKKVKSIL